MNYLQVKDFEEYTKHKPEAIVQQYFKSLLYNKGETILDAINRKSAKQVITYLSDVLDVQIKVANQKGLK
jgi:hypothetical protein